MSLQRESDLGTPARRASAIVTLTVDGQAISVPEGTSVMRAAGLAGIDIPKLCATDSLEPFGSCRLCLVEVDGVKGTPASCTTPVAEGMAVHTETPWLAELRRGVMELYISDHPLDCLTCAANGDCELQDMAGVVGLREVRYGFEGAGHVGAAKDTSTPYFDFDPGKCIVCSRCVRACDEVQGGLEFIQKKTGVPVLGVLPWLPDLDLPAEDSVALGSRSKVSTLISGQKRIQIGILKLPRISNFTDFDTLHAEPDVSIGYVETAEQIAPLDLLIIPGSKSTIADMYFLMERGIHDAIRAFKGNIAGICGGYQMLGQRVLDPFGIESSIREAVGLGLLPVETEMLPDKETHQALAYLEDGGLATAPDCSGVISGYEIHMGKTTPTGEARSFARIFRRGDSYVTVEDGTVSADGRVFGTYLHGIFDNLHFRETYLNRIRLEKGLPLRTTDPAITRQDPFDRLAEHLEQHLDMPLLLDICGLDQ